MYVRFGGEYLETYHGNVARRRMLSLLMIIGIIGYFTIPTVAGWIIQAGGGMGAYGRHINSVGMQGGSAIAGVAGSAAGNVAGRVGKLLK